MMSESEKQERGDEKEEEGQAQNVNGDRDSSSLPPPNSTERQLEQDSEQNAENGHDNNAGEEEDRDGGVKVHDDDDDSDRDGQTNNTELPSGEEGNTNSASTAPSHETVHEQQNPEHEERRQGGKEEAANLGGENAEETRDPSTITTFPANNSTEPTECAENTEGFTATENSSFKFSQPVDPSTQQNSSDPPGSNLVPEHTDTEEHSLSESTEQQAPSEDYKVLSDTKPCDHELPSPPPAEDHTTAETSEAVAAEHAGSSQAAEVVVVDEPQPESLDTPEDPEAPPTSVLAPEDDTKSEEAAVDTREEELPGEAESPLETTKSPTTEDLPARSTPTEYTSRGEFIPLDPPNMSDVSEVSALSDRPEMTSIYPTHGISYARDPFDDNPSTSFAAGPLDDEAAAAAGLEALALAAEVPDSSKRSRKEKDRSHRKKEKPGDGTERVKEKKHREKGDKDRVKSRDRGDRVRDRSAHPDGGERSRDRDRAKSRDRLGEYKEKKHRTPEEKAEREARKAAKRALSAPAPAFADNVTAEPFEQPYDPRYDPRYDQQYEEERSHEEKRKHKKSSKRSTPAPFTEPMILDSPEAAYDQQAHEERSRGDRKPKKARPPPITIEPHGQPYDPNHQQVEDQIKRRKSSKSKAEAVFGESIPSAIEGHQGPPPPSPFIDGPIEQPKRKKSSKKTTGETGVEIEPVHVVYEPEAQPPKSRRSRSNSMKPPIENGSGGGSGGDKDKKHRRKDSAHLSPEEREERRRKHEEKALRKGKELEDHLRNSPKEDRRAEKAARKAVKAKADTREDIPQLPLTPDDLPIQSPEDNTVSQSDNGYEGSQLRSPYLHHRDQQDGALLSPNREQHGEVPVSPRSFMGEEDAAKAEKARRRAERRARKEQESEAMKDSGHSLSSEGKREQREHSKKHKSRNRSRARIPGTPEEEEARRIRKEEKREARRLAAQEGGQKGDGRPEGKTRKHRDSGGGRARSGSEKYGSKEKDMFRELEIGAPVEYGNYSQTPWMAGAQQPEEEGKKGVMGRVRKIFGRG